MLAHDVLAKIAAGLARRQLEPGWLIDVARGAEDAMRPQGDAAVAALPGEADALVGQALADPQAARPGLDQEKAQTRHFFFAVPHQQPRAGVAAVDLRDPATLAARIELVGEVGDDLCAHGLEV